VIPWPPVPRAATGQEPAAVRSRAAGDGKGERDPVALSEVRLGLARERVAAIEAMVKEAEARAKAVTAQRAYREKQRDRFVRLEKRGAIGRMQVEEEEERLRMVQAEERAAKAGIAAARASLDVDKARIREAEARRDIARIESRGGGNAGAEDELKKARARLRGARLDRARSERDVARAQLDLDEARLSQTKANVACQTKVFERCMLLAGATLIRERQLQEAKLDLVDARAAVLEAEDRLETARADLFAAEAGIKAAEAEAKRDATGSRPATTAPGPH
jgi:multidrug resistance efflux pump